jgi:hypothetical protein
VKTNLKTETCRNLNIKVTPHVSRSSLSFAALVGGPIVAVAAFVAQKILKDPLIRLPLRIQNYWHMDNPIEVKLIKMMHKKSVNPFPARILNIKIYSLQPKQSTQSKNSSNSVKVAGIQMASSPVSNLI